MTAKLTVSVGVPAYGGVVAAEHARMWAEFGMALADSSERFIGAGIGYIDVCGIDVARNTLLEHALAANADWLIMLDADTWVEDGMELLSMVSAGDREGAAVIAGAVPRRVTGATPRTLMVYDHAGHAVSWVPQGVTTWTAVATACIAIDLAFVRERVAKPWFEFVPGGLSEDLNFCRKVREAGGEIIVDGRVRCRHRNRPEILKTEDYR